MSDPTDEGGPEYPMKRRLVLLRPTYPGSDVFKMNDEQWLQMGPPKMDSYNRIFSEKVLVSSMWTGGTYRKTRSVNFADLNGDPKDEFRDKETLAFLSPNSYLWDFFEQLEGAPYTGEVPCTGTSSYLEIAP